MNTNTLVVLVILAILIFMIMREVRTRRSVRDMREKDMRNAEVEEFEHWRGKLEWVLSNQEPRVLTTDPRMRLVRKNSTELDSTGLIYWQGKIKEELLALGALDGKTEAENAELEGVRQNQAALASHRKPFEKRREDAKKKHSKIVKPIEGF